MQDGGKDRRGEEGRKLTWLQLEDIPREPRFYAYMVAPKAVLLSLIAALKLLLMDDFGLNFFEGMQSPPPPHFYFYFSTQ